MCRCGRACCRAGQPAMLPALCWAACLLIGGVLYSMYAQTTLHQNVQMWLLLRCRLIEGAHLTAVQRVLPLPLQQPLMVVMHPWMQWWWLTSHHSTTGLLPICSSRLCLQTHSSRKPSSNQHSLPCRCRRPLQVRPLVHPAPRCGPFAGAVSTIASAPEVLSWPRNPTSCVQHQQQQLSA